MNDWLASATQQATGDGIAWPQAIPWLLAGVSTCFNAYQWIRSRRPLVRAKVITKKSDRPAEAHARWLTVEVANYGADLHDMAVQLEWTKDGKKLTHPLTVVGDVPNPFKLGHSRRFTLVNENPRQSAGVDDVPTDQIAVVIYSGIRKVKLLGGRKVKKEIDDFSKPDPSLPTKSTPPKRDGGDWLHGGPNL